MPLHHMADVPQQMSTPQVCMAPQPQNQCSLACPDMRTTLEETGPCEAYSQPSGVQSLESEEKACFRWGDFDHVGEQPMKKLSTSAARRLRRKRAVERHRATAQADNGEHEQSVEVVKSSSARELCYDEVQRQLSEAGRATEAVFALQGHIWELARDASGCRIVQLAFEHTSQRDAAKLVKELHGHVCEAATSPHANYVLQKVVSQLSVGTSSFIAKELVGNCSRIVRHRYGCRVFCRLLEFCSCQDLTLQLLDEILVEAEDLCCHSFGHHVMQSVLEHGREEHRTRVAMALCVDPVSYAKHKNASYLVENALRHCCQEDQQALLKSLADSTTIKELALSQYGSYVARALLLDFSEKTDLGAATAAISSVSGQLQESRHGQRLLVDLGLVPALLDGI